MPWRACHGSRFPRTVDAMSSGSGATMGGAGAAAGAGAGAGAGAAPVGGARSALSGTHAWKSAAFCGLFGDAFLGSTEVEGMNVASSTRVLAAALQDMAAAPGDVVLAPLPGIVPVPEDPSGASDAAPGGAEDGAADGAGGDESGVGASAPSPPTDVAAVVDSADSVKGALDAAAGLLRPAAAVAELFFTSAPPSSEATVAALAEARRYIANVQPGGSVLLPVGWRTKQSGHAMWLLLRRAAAATADGSDADAGEAGDTSGTAGSDEAASTSSDVFEVIVCNAGPGLQYHRSSFATYPKPRFQTTLRLAGVPRSRLLDEAFLYMLYQAVMTPHDDNNAKLLYEVLLPHLCGRPLMDVGNTEPAADEAGEAGAGAGAGEGDQPTAGVAAVANADTDALSTPQRAGLCFVKSTLAAVKFVLRDAGLGARRVKVIMFALRLHMLGVAVADLEEAAQINDSDRRLVKLACKQSAVAAVKLHRAGCINVAALRDIHVRVVQLRKSLMAIRVVGQKFEYPAKVQMRMDAPLVPLPGFNLVHNTDSTEQFAGEAQDSAPSLFVDLLEQGPKQTFEEIAAALQRAEAQCDRLRAKTAVSAASIAIHQIACLVENLFTRVLPVPKPWSQELADSGETSPWIPAELSLDTQRACLRALYRLGVQYVSAVKSVK